MSRALVVLVSMVMVLSALAMIASTSIAKANDYQKPLAFVAELQPSGTTKDLLSVAFVDYLKGWAGGKEETLIKTSSSGSNWLVDRTGGAGEYDDIQFQDANNGNIAGTACWGPNPDPNYSGKAHVLQSGGQLIRDWSAILRTSNGGGTWNKVFTPTNFIISSVQFRNQNLGMITAYGSLSHTDSDIWYTSNGGKFFDDYGDWQYYVDSFMIDDNNWWVVGDEMIHTADAGKTWTPKSVSSHLNAIFFYDAQNGWAAGNGGTIMGTTDGGATWTKQTSGVSATFNGIHFVSKTDGWVVGASGTILYTTNGGGTWSPLQSPTTVDLNDVDFPDPNYGWAVGNSGKVVFIHNGTPPPPPKGKLSSVQVDPSSATMNINDTKKFAATGLDTSGNPIPGLTFTWTLSQQLGTLTQLSANEVEFKATAAGNTTLSAETSYNGTNGKGVSSITIKAPPPPPPPNKAPNTPTATGPTSGNTGQSLAYDISATDPDNDQVKYTVDWGDGMNQTTNLGASGWKASIAHSWSAQGSYNVKSKGIDAKGAESSWSYPLAVSITKPSGGGSPPSAPTLAGPAQGTPATEYSYTVSSTDPDGNKVMFTIDWGDGKNDVTGFVASGASATAKHTWSTDGNYTVKAKAKDETGLESSWTSIVVHIATYAQDQPPVITHIPIAQATEGTQITVQATVTDDVGVESATLYYRKQGAASWTSIPMQGSGSQFSAVIPATAVVKGTMEYYIQAEDSGANVVKSSTYTITVKAKGTSGGNNNTQAAKGIDATVMSLAIVAAVIAAVVIVALLLMRRRGKKDQMMMTYPPYFAQQYEQYPQQYDGYQQQYEQ